MGKQTPKIELSECGGEWDSTVKAANGKLLGYGRPGYSSKDKCLKGVEALKDALARGKIVVV